VQLLPFRQKASNPDPSKIVIPRIFASLFKREMERESANKRMSLMMFQPMELDKWCRIWIPEIDPELTAPAPGDTKNPYGYLLTAKITLLALTGYSKKSILLVGVLP